MFLATYQLDDTSKPGREGSMKNIDFCGSQWRQWWASVSVTQEASCLGRRHSVGTKPTLGFWPLVLPRY